jgi:hypothetical protein
VFLASGVRADLLDARRTGRLKGELDEVLFRVDGIPKVIARRSIAAFALGEDGKDLLTLRSGKRHEGKLLSVTFRSHGRLWTLPRQGITVLEIDEALPEAPPAPPPAERAHRAADRQARAHALDVNARLHETFRGRIDAMRKAEIRDIERGPRGVKRAKRTLTPGQMASIDEQAQARRWRIDAVAKENERVLLEGELLTETAMLGRYEGALTGLSAAERARQIKVRSLTTGVKIKRGPNKDTPELIVDPFPEERR